MSQLFALVWLKWTLFKNSMRSRKAAVGRAAATLGSLAGLALALLVAVGLGTASYFLTSPGGVHQEQAAEVQKQLPDLE